MAEQMEMKLKAMGVEVFIDNGVQKPGPVSIDLLIVLGGDGTVIRAAREYAQSGV
jgi:NAD+ kinase